MHDYISFLKRQMKELPTAAEMASKLEPLTALFLFQLCSNH